jgi:hypothetical protein
MDREIAEVELERQANAAPVFDNKGVEAAHVWLHTFRWGRECASWFNCLPEYVQEKVAKIIRDRLRAHYAIRSSGVRNGPAHADPPEALGSNEEGLWV